MSAEHFETILAVDVRTAPDGRNVEYERAGEGQPRMDWHNRQRDAWVMVHPYAEQVVQIAARAVEDQPMEGLTGDHPEKRVQVAAILHVAAAAVRALACDDACDGAVTDDEWANLMHKVRVAASSDQQRSA